MNAFQKISFLNAVGKTLTHSILLLLLASMALANDASNSLDKKLLNSIKNRQFDTFERLLSTGANPNVILGNVFSDIPMCVATRVGNELYLKKLVQYGGDVNLFNADSLQKWSTPLACSIFMRNRNSFEYLLSVGADPGANLCPKCEKKENRSHLGVALISTQFDMVMQLIELTEVDQSEMDRIIFILELVRTRADHVTNDARTELIEWVRAQGHEVNPTAPGRY